MSTHSWISCGTSARGADVKVFCFPYAGSGASCYRRLAKLLPNSVDVLPVQLPGREDRLEEPPLGDMDTLVDAIVDGIESYVRGRSVFLGYSLGALVAFEVARALQWAARPIERLIVCASGGPTLLRGPEAPLRIDDGDEALIRRLQALGGTPRRLLEDKELMGVLLPAVRADFRILDGYRYEPGPPLRCPVNAIGGDLDHTVPLADLNAWRECTSSHFESIQVRGDHFFIHSAPEVLAKYVESVVGVKQSAALCV